MKKSVLYILACVVLLALCLTACGSSKSSTAASESAAPTADSGTDIAEITSYNSLDELNSAVGARLYCPNDVAENQAFSTIKTADFEVPIAEYTYSLDARDYMVRFSSDFTAGGISGLQAENGKAFGDPNASDFQEFTTVKGDNYYAAHWLTVDGQYVFAVLNPDDMEFSAFESIANTYRDGTAAADS